MFLQLALGLVALSLINSAIFNVSLPRVSDNAYNDSSAYLVIDPLQYLYIASFVFTSVLHPALATIRKGMTDGN
jgi:hypothetical protein